MCGAAASCFIPFKGTASFLVVSQFEVRGSNFCAEGLRWIASANHATDCIAAASMASFDV